MKNNKFKVDYVTTVNFYREVSGLVIINSGADIYGNCKELRLDPNKMFVLDEKAKNVGDLALYKIKSLSTGRICFMIALKLKEQIIKDNFNTSLRFFDAVNKYADRFYKPTK